MLEIDKTRAFIENPAATAVVAQSGAAATAEPAPHSSHGSLNGGATAPAAQPAVALSRVRFWVLGNFALTTALSAFTWICVAPIASVAADKFAVSVPQINLLSLVFMIFYAPASVLAMWIMEARGLRAALIFGSVLNAACVWVKYAGVMVSDPALAWGLSLFGQILGAIAQPAILNAPARLSMDFFGERERELATVAATMANVFGQMAGSLIPPYVVNGVGDLPALMLYQAIPGAVIALLSFTLWDKPPAPPSVAAAQQWEARAKAAQSGGAMAALAAVWADTKALCRNLNFVLVMVGFAIAVGMAWTLLTVQAQIIQPCGYDDTLAGESGAALLGVGVLVSFAVGPLLERTKGYLLTHKILLLLSIAAAAFALAVNRPDSAALVVVSWCVLGGILEPILPVALELAAEITYPIAADSSSSLLLTAANVVAMVLTFVLGAVLQVPVSANCESIVTPAAGVVLLFLIVGAIITLFVKPDMRRQAAAKARLADGSASKVGGVPPPAAP